VPKDAFEAWQQAQYRLTVIEEERRLPYLLAAIPTEMGAQQLGLASEELEEILLPALRASVGELQDEIGRVLNKVGDVKRSQSIVGITTYYIWTTVTAPG